MEIHSIDIEGRNTVYVQNERQAVKEASDLLGDPDISSVCVSQYTILSRKLTSAVACRLLNRDKFFDEQIVIWKDGEYVDGRNS